MQITLLMRALSQVPNQWKLTTEAEHTTLCIQWTVDTKMPTLSVSLYAVTPPPHTESALTRSTS